MAAKKATKKKSPYYRYDPTLNAILPSDGTIVTAKRAGWEEKIPFEKSLDLAPYNEDGDLASDDLKGPVKVIKANGIVGTLPPFTTVLVAGQEADPATVQWTDEITGNAFCPTGPGGGVDPSCSPGQSKGPKSHAPKSLPAIPSKAPSPQAATHLHSGDAVAAHVAARNPDNPKAAFTPLLIEKIKALNPNGIAGGIFVTPWVAGSPAGKIKQDAQVEHLKKILPPGTQIKVKQLSGHKIGIGEPKPLKEIAHPKGDGQSLPSPGSKDDPFAGHATPAPEAKTSKKSKAEPASPPYVPQPHLPTPDPSHVEVIKTLPGSTQPKLVKDKDGNHWVMKSGAGKEPQVQNEAQADAIYRALGIPTPNGGLHTGPDGASKFTQFIEGSQTLADWKKDKSPAAIAAMHKEIGKHFAVDALLANWDVVGLSQDNILVHNGVPYRADNGGALLYRAQGAPKGAKFGAEVGELKSLRDPAINPSTAAVYKHLTDHDVHQQMQDIVGKADTILGAINDPQTKNLIAQRIEHFKTKLKEPAPVSQPPDTLKPGTAHIIISGQPSEQFKKEHPHAHKSSPNEKLPDEARKPISQKTVAAAITSYTSSAYATLNDRLRRGVDLEDKAGLHERLTKAFADLPVFKTPVPVNRGITLKPEDVNKLEELAKGMIGSGKLFEMKGYLSTSTNKGFSGPVKLHIDAVQGIDVRPYSSHPHENELLLNHLSKFQVYEVERKGDILHLKLRQIPTTEFALHDPTASVPFTVKQDIPTTNELRTVSKFDF